MRDRNRQLHRWWTSLSAAEREHARACVSEGVGDAWMEWGLMTNGIGVAIAGASESSDVVMRIPRDLEVFVNGRPPT